MCALNVRVLFVMHCVMLCGMLFVVVFFVWRSTCVDSEFVCDVVWLVCLSLRVVCVCVCWFYACVNCECIL